MGKIEKIKGRSQERVTKFYFMGLIFLERKIITKKEMNWHLHINWDWPDQFLKPEKNQGF